MRTALRIAIDGPSGSGKSTLGRGLARHLELPYVDTGAMYRAVAWKAHRMGATERSRIVELLDETTMRVDTDPDAFRVWVDGTDVSDELRDPQVSSMSSTVAAIEEVREWLVPRQRALADGGAVMEGRDIGTVVLPDADFKFFVTAAEAERIARRAAQWKQVDMQDARRDVKERDHRDSSRRTSPLRPAADAVRIDTTEQTVEESLRTMLALIESRDRE